MNLLLLLVVYPVLLVADIGWQLGYLVRGRTPRSLLRDTTFEHTAHEEKAAG